MTWNPQANRKRGINSEVLMICLSLWVLMLLNVQAWPPDSPYPSLALSFLLSKLSSLPLSQPGTILPAFQLVLSLQAGASHPMARLSFLQHSLSTICHPDLGIPEQLPLLTLNPIANPEKKKGGFAHLLCSYEIKSYIWRSHRGFCDGSSFQVQKRKVP